MATTTSKLNLYSADLTSDKLSLAIESTFTKTSGDNITTSSGVQRATIAAGATNTTLLANTLAYINKSTGVTYGTNLYKNYIYLKNCTEAAGEGEIMIFSDGGDVNLGNAGEFECEESACDHAIAVLAKDDWMILPSPMYAGLIITNIDASNAALVEIMILS